MSNQMPDLQSAASTLALPRLTVPRTVDRSRAHSRMLRPLRVMKFGGTSVGDAACIRKVAEIIHNNFRESDLVIVVSAMAGVTNKLIEAATLAEARNMAQAAQVIDDLRQQHEAAIGTLIHSEAERARVRRSMSGLLEECSRCCESTAVLGELTPRTRDWISSVGERLSVPLVAAALATRGLNSEPIEATELIVTDSFHGAADPKMDLTGTRCEQRLRALVRGGVIPIVTGFIGATEAGVLTTLGRGGSDYSASILGAALKADEVVIWTDVDGMLTADPRLVEGATTIPEISYREASELAYFGAKVLHPKTLRPVMQGGIPVWIRNTFAPEKKGTKITPAGSTSHGGVKALTAVGEAALIRVGGPAVSNAHDVLGRTLATTKAVRADVLLISKSPSRNHIFLVVAASVAQRTVEALRHEFIANVDDGTPDHICVDSTVAILTVVGENLHAVKEIVGRAIDELNRDSVNILAVGQGSSACNVSFVIARKDLRTALITTHNEFERGPSEPPISNRSNGQSFMIPGQSTFASEASREVSEFPRSYRVLASTAPAKARDVEVLDEASFRSMIAHERKRTERSRKPVLLLLLDVGKSLTRDKNGKLLNNVLSALAASTRDTDVTGWYETQSVIGVMFTEIGIEDPGAILGTMMHRVSETLRGNLSLEKFSQVRISLHVFPENWSQEVSEGNPTLYPDLERREKAQRFGLILKRTIDIVGSLAALILLSPLFLLVAVLVKLSSKGPILFQQERLGQFGKTFTFLKFRSMYVNNDPKIHQEFMKRLIGGNHHGQAEGTEDRIYKMTNDPRITRIGHLLRKTSLDELPQFFNVLRGEMSLVGPRPPLAYEWQEYDIWHRRRVLEVKPGITGLWQVSGRSRVDFDDMVRLDLQYVRSWSLWGDLKIILKTPLAVLRSGDAF
ncbi:MAG TPA: aspartate kinase [Candidatus Sulfotelmatobacter sp.]|nr:aspartate kinase [Candidatus Sulfotelmatobacter sp.]